MTIPNIRSPVVVGIQVSLHAPIWPSAHGITVNSVIPLANKECVF